MAMDCKSSRIPKSAGLLVWFSSLVPAVCKSCSWEKAGTGVTYASSPWSFSIDEDCTELSLSQYFMVSLRDEGIRVLANSLRHLPLLSLLDLQGNGIGDTGAHDLAEALHLTPNIKLLQLAGNNIGMSGARALAAAVRQLPQLVELDISFNKIGPEGAGALADAIAFVEVARGDTGSTDVLGIDEGLLDGARHRAMHSQSGLGAPALDVNSTVHSPPTMPSAASATAFSKAIRRVCASLLPVASAGRFLEQSLASLGVEDLASLRILDDSDVELGLRDAGIPVAPRKQLRKCLGIVAADSEL